MVNTGNTLLGRGKGALRIRSQPECASKLKFDKWLVVYSLATRNVFRVRVERESFLFLVCRGKCVSKCEVRCAMCGVRHCNARDEYGKACLFSMQGLFFNFFRTRLRDRRDQVRSGPWTGLVHEM